jgi:hypothetical protein
VERKIINVSKNSLRKTYAIVSVIVVTVIFLLFWIYQTRQAKEDEKAREQLQAQISKQISLYKSGEAKTIDLSKIESFAWDRLYIFGPYVSLDIIQKRLGYSWRPDSHWLLGADTPFSLLVFTLDGEVVRYVEYPTVLDNFSNAGEKIDGYARHEAVFVINEYGYILWVDR